MLAGNDDAGYFADHAVATNARALSMFRCQVIDLWRRALRRRSQEDRTSWTDTDRLGQSLAARAPDIPP
jgi:RNA-directed DNA polymerase